MFMYLAGNDDDTAVVPGLAYERKEVWYQQEVGDIINLIRRLPFVICKHWINKNNLHKYDKVS